MKYRYEQEPWASWCGTTQNREFKISRRWAPRKRRLKLIKFAFFQSLSRLLQLIHFVKYNWTLFEPNSKEPCSSSERKRKFSRRLFTSSIKRGIRHFHVVSVQWRQRNVQKSVMHSWCTCRVVVLPIQPIAILKFSLSSPSWHLLKSLFKFY